MKHTRYFLAGLTILCVFMIAVTSIRGSLLNPLRNAVGALLVPVQSGINAVGGGIYKEVSAMTELRQALSENEKLQAQVDELTEENTRLRSEEQELSRLRELYQLDQDYMEYNKVGARIIAKDSSSWFSVFRIDKGSEDGIRENMNVIAGGGLVGIVTDVGTNYATVRSIIDDSSNVSGMVLSTSDRCIFSGDLSLMDDGQIRFEQREHNEN